MKGERDEGAEDDRDENRSGRLPLSTKLSYGIGGICDNTLYTLVSTYLLLYLTGIAGLKPAVAGGIAAMGSLWDALCGPVMGAWSDRVRTRLGQRKPFLLAAAFPVALFTGLLFTAIDAGPRLKALYYLVMTVAFWTAFAGEFIPYMAWGSELTADYDERTVLRSYSYVFNQIGMCIGMVLPTVIVDLLTGAGRTTAQAWQAVGIFCGACGGAALLICALTIRRDDVPRGAWRAPKRTSLTLWQSLRQTFSPYAQILRLRPAWFLIGASILYLVANTIFSSDRVFYMTYTLGLSQRAITAVMLLITVSGVAFVPVISRLAQKLDKRTVFMGGIGGAGLILVVMRFAGGDTMGALIITCLVYSVANTCYWQLMPALLYDFCEVDALYYGRNRAGSVISLQALSESLSIAVSMQALGLVLDVAGFAGEAPVQTPQALTWISNLCTLVPGLFMVAVALVIRCYPLTKGMFSRVTAALAAREAGDPAPAERLKACLASGRHAAAKRRARGKEK